MFTDFSFYFVVGICLLFLFLREYWNEWMNKYYKMAFVEVKYVAKQLKSFDFLILENLFIW